MKKKLFILSGLALSLTPVFAFAQVNINGSNSGSCDLTTTGGTLFGLLCKVGSLLNSIVPVLIALGVLYFIWGVISYVIADDEEAKSKGRDRIIFGIIGLAVVIGVWGLVNLLRNTFGLNNTQNFTVPTVPVVIPGQGGNNAGFQSSN